MGFRDVFHLQKKLAEEVERAKEINKDAIEHLDEEREERVEIDNRLENLHVELEVLNRRRYRPT